MVLTGADSREVTSVTQCIKIIESANHNRVTSSTAMNDQVRHRRADPPFASPPSPSLNPTARPPCLLPAPLRHPVPR